MRGLTPKLMRSLCGSVRNHLHLSLTPHGSPSSKAYKPYETSAMRSSLIFHPIGGCQTIEQSGRFVHWEPMALVRLGQRTRAPAIYSHFLATPKPG